MKATIEQLRDKFFEECVSENTGGYKVINYAPHDLFEWIKENIIQPEPQKETIEELRKEFCEIYKLEYIPLMSNILFQYVQHLEQKLIQPEPIVSEPKQVTEE